MLRWGTLRWQARLIQRPRPSNRCILRSRLSMKRGHYTSTVPQRVLLYRPERKRDWDTMWRRWKASQRMDRSVWKRFRKVLDIPGFKFDVWNGGRFAEAVVALDLERKGYKCFRACSLFRTGRGKFPETTALAEARLKKSGHRLPHKATKRILPKPRNPDLAAYRGRKWRFCEVKWKRSERVSKGQLAALCVLRSELKADVEVVRVIPTTDRGRRYRKSYECEYTVR